MFLSPIKRKTPGLIPKPPGDRELMNYCCHAAAQHVCEFSIDGFYFCFTTCLINPLQAYTSLERYYSIVYDQWEASGDVTALDKVSIIRLGVIVLISPECEGQQHSYCKLHDISRW